MKRAYSHLRGRAFSLLEAMVSVMILAIVAAIVSPVVSSVSDLYVATMSTRRISERAGFAVERCVRFVREIPLGADATMVGIRSADPEAIVLENGAGIALSGDQILLTDTSGRASVLCSSVESFTLSYLSADGVTSAAAAPGLTRRINISLKAAGFELRSAACIRSGTSL